jgi:hypothetical protein
MGDRQARAERVVERHQPMTAAITIRPFTVPCWRRGDQVDHPPGCCAAARPVVELQAGWSAWRDLRFHGVYDHGLPTT